MMKKLIQLNVNGISYEAAVEPSMTLLDALRDELHITGVKKAATKETTGPAPYFWTEKQ